MPLLALIGIGVIGACVAYVVAWGFGRGQQQAQGALNTGFVVTAVVLVGIGLSMGVPGGVVASLADNTLQSGVTGWLAAADGESAVYVVVVLALFALLRGALRGRSRVAGEIDEG